MAKSIILTILVLGGLSGCVSQPIYESSYGGYEQGYYEPNRALRTQQRQGVDAKIDACLSRAGISGPVNLVAPKQTTDIRELPRVLRAQNVGYTQKRDFDNCITDNYK